MNNEEIKNNEVEEMNKQPIIIEAPEEVKEEAPVAPAAEPIVIEEPVAPAPEPIVIEEPKVEPIVTEPTPAPAPVVETPVAETPAPVAQPQQQLPPTNNKQGGNGLLIAIIIVLGIVAVVCITVFVMNNFSGDKDGNNGGTPAVNEYENNGGTPTPTPTTTPTPTATPTTTPGGNTASNGAVSYKGFNFTKIPGFEYKLDSESGYLIVYNSNTAATIEIDYLPFDDVIANKDVIQQSIQSDTITATDYKSSTYNGVRIVSFVIKSEGASMLYYMAESTVKGYTIYGLAFNSSYTVDYSILNTVANVVKNANQGGTTFNKTNEDRNVKSKLDMKVKNFKF